MIEFNKPAIAETFLPRGNISRQNVGMDIDLEHDFILSLVAY